MTETTDTVENCDRCANHDPRDRRDHGHVHEPETTTGAKTTAPPLFASIGQILVGLVRHAGEHGYAEGLAGEPADKTDAPECLVGHISEVSEVLFRVADPKNHGARVVLPRDMPEGLVEQLQQLAHAEIAKMEGRA